MASRGAPFYPYEDPWRASAFCFAFTQLVVTILVLIHTILVCITFQLMKWYGWWIPFWDGGYRPGVPTHFGPSAPKNASNHDFQAHQSSPPKNASNHDFQAHQSSPLISTKRLLKRSCSDNCRSLKSKPVVCLRCHGVWNLKPSLSFKSTMGATCKWGESTCSDGGDSYSAKGSCEEAEVRSKKADGVMTYDIGDELDAMSKAESHADLRSSISTSLERLRSLARKAANCNTEKLGSSQAINREVQHDGTDRLLLELPGTKRFCWKNDGSGKTHELNGRMGSFHNPLEEMQNESGAYFAAEECLVSLEEKCNSKEIDREAVIRSLTDALQRERRKLGTLYAELEVERIASETAANEAMAMIARLQEDKATLRMQAAHYHRMVEEKAIHDEQAMQLLKEILYKKERENYLLEKEVKVIRARFGRDGRRLSRRRKGLDAVLHEHLGLLKDVEDASEGTGSSIQGIEVKGEPEMLPCSSSHASEEQPSKRLKGVADHDIIEEQSDRLSVEKIFDNVANFEPILGENSHSEEPNIAAQPSILTSSNGDHASFDPGAINAYREAVKSAEDVERMTNAINDTDDKSIIELSYAEVDQSPHLKLECMQGMISCKQSPVPKPIEGNQVAPSHHFCEVRGFHQLESLVREEEENLCPNKQTSSELCSFAPCPSKGTVGQASPGMTVKNGIHVVSSGMRTNIALCSMTSPELWHCASAEFLQTSLHDNESALRDHTRRDLQVQQGNRMPPSKH